MSLRDYGWSDFFAESLEALQDTGLEPARVIQSGSASPRVMAASGEVRATVAGRLRLPAAGAVGLPVVGDWVAIRSVDEAGARIEHVLPRRTKLSRKAPGRTSEEQIVAANLDVVLIVMGLDGDFNVRRLERLLTTVLASGARPVVLLNKLDICADPPGRLAEVRAVVRDSPVVLMSCLNGDGLGEVREHIGRFETSVLLGSSGVGKSTLINSLMGESVQLTGAVRKGDGRGRHTTSHRELFRLPDGGLLIDNPGIRELQLWAGDESLTQAFTDIAELSAACRYRDCSHSSEPGCAVLERIETGALEPARLEAYRALQREIQSLRLRQDEFAQREQKKQLRTVHRGQRRFYRRRGR